MPQPILQVSHLSKSFSGTRALENVGLEIFAGEVHALMGENGAGKSTLMKVLMGLVKPDAGTIIFDGEPIVPYKNTQQLKGKLAMIHQELLVVPGLTVAQNLFLGREREFSFSFLLRDGAMNTAAQGILSRLGLTLDPSIPMQELSISQMQMVEIAKAVSMDARVIVMDEPTSAISDREVAALFAIIADLKAKGVAIVYISHKMDEVFKISDRITVLRDGRHIRTAPASSLDQEQLIGLMVGREIKGLHQHSALSESEEVLSVVDLGKSSAFSGINFSLHAGEVLGIAGLMGAGRTELARVLYGLDQPDRGQVFIDKEAVVIGNPRQAITLGIGYVSEDRKRYGFIPKMSVAENLTLSSLLRHRKGFALGTESEKEVVDRNVQSLNIKSAGRNQKVGELSGGNQQKIVLGRVMNADPRIIILDEPTRGVDIGAKFEIYRLIEQWKASGKAIIMISSELPEILGISDRILVLAQGRQTALLSRTEASEERIMKHALQ
ncbi:sugar ABC transporter ATP-binding protein [Dyadobacter tibetensis]|uniref:sugar ABC transporter ATP-binding protein n=1 Tax=Dyadobacter tibetensis TaxID=1211851 RepID=UPI00046E71FC|nr:sugar ABC transporter ATP-binding protein [Dyadobacter tibetensis]